MQKKIPTKNYIMVLVIFIIVIVAVIYLASWYNTYQDFQKEIPVLQGTISEVKTDELDHYLLENPTTVVYICTANNDECRDFETQYKKEILKNEWQDSMTYLNVDTSDVTQYLSSLLDRYATANFTLDRVPALIAFEDGQIVAAISGINGNRLTISEANRFMDRYHIKI